MTDDVPPEAVQAIQHYIDTRHEFLSWLGVEIEELTTDGAVMRIPYQTKLTNVPIQGEEPETNHPVQGGVASTLVDTVGGIALRPHLDDPVNDSIATINLNVNYLRQATNDLRAEAEVIRAGGTVGVSEILVESEAPDGEVKPVAIGMGAYRMFRSD